MIRSAKVLRHAKGQQCTARFPGICNGNPETTVFCHLNGAAFGKGMGIKAHDVLGFFGCSDCHAYYDTGHGTKAWLDDATLMECLLEAVCQTWVTLISDGIVIVPLDAERLSSERQVKPRKPREQRARIPHNPDRKIPTRPMRAKERT
jgi:hypothetical protein